MAGIRQMTGGRRILVEADRLGLTALQELVSQGPLTPTVVAIFPLRQTSEAQSSKSGPGKTVLTVVSRG
ncbi:hypothetical protein [Gordonia jacobaea]|uniref:hypothetical protein n=1 Tax=Gordonia jacobaea TaxID=122202 RepID=UPI003D702C7E